MEHKIIITFIWNRISVANKKLMYVMVSFMDIEDKSTPEGLMLCFFLKFLDLWLNFLIHKLQLSISHRKISLVRSGGLW